MKLLIIYDDEGFIIDQKFGEGYRIPVGIPYLELELSSNKRVVSIDVSVTPNVAIFEDIPLSETELLKKRIEEQEVALVELASLIGGTV